MNRNVDAERDESIRPFQAVIEFKLFPQGWTKGRAAGFVAELGKLWLTAESPLRYMVGLMRYRAESSYRWDKYSEKAFAAMDSHPETATLVAVQWLTAKFGEDQYSSGPWLNA